MNFCSNGSVCARTHTHPSSKFRNEGLVLCSWGSTFLHTSELHCYQRSQLPFSSFNAILWTSFGWRKPKLSSAHIKRIDFQRFLPTTPHCSSTPTHLRRSPTLWNCLLLTMWCGATCSAQKEKRGSVLLRRRHLGTPPCRSFSMSPLCPVVNPWFANTKWGTNVTKSGTVARFMAGVKWLRSRGVGRAPAQASFGFACQHTMFCLMALTVIVHQCRRAYRIRMAMLDSTQQQRTSNRKIVSQVCLYPSKKSCTMLKTTKTHPLRPSFYKWYVDDTLLIWPCGETHLQAFVSHLNSFFWFHSIYERAGS